MRTKFLVFLFATMCSSVGFADNIAIPGSDRISPLSKGRRIDARFSIAMPFNYLDRYLQQLYYQEGTVGVEALFQDGVLKRQCPSESWSYPKNMCLVNNISGFPILDNNSDYCSVGVRIDKSKTKIKNDVLQIEQRSVVVPGGSGGSGNEGGVVYSYRDFWDIGSLDRGEAPSYVSSFRCTKKCKMGDKSCYQSLAIILANDVYRATGSNLQMFYSQTNKAEATNTGAAGDPSSGEGRPSAGVAP